MAAPAERVTAVLLAAGLGSRFGGAPKALIEVAGRPLLERCADALARNGVTRLAVVTGHGAIEVESFWGSTPRSLEAVFLFNERYSDLNNFHTLAVACAECEAGPLLVVNSDIVFDPDVVAAVLATDGDLVLGVEEGAVDGEALKVRLSDGVPDALGKDLDPSGSFGEFIGISVLSPRAREDYSAAAHHALTQGERNLYYEDVYSRICRKIDSRVTRVSPEAWAEIDSPRDLPAAQLVGAAQDRRAWA